MGRPRVELGFTLVESLVAMALLLIVTIGILPLFTRAMVNNAAGSESTQVANHARHQLEDLGQLPFNNTSLTVAAGNELLNLDHYWIKTNTAPGDHDETWLPDGQTLAGGIVQWDRQTRVRQFGITGLIDNDADGIIDGLAGLEDQNKDGEPDSPLAAGTDPSFVHLKEVTVELTSPRDDAGRAGGPLGASTPAYRVRVLRPF